MKRSFITENVAAFVSGLHESSREVDDAADDGVLAAPGVADLAAVDATCCNANRARHSEPCETRANCDGGLDAEASVVLVRKRRKSERRDQRRSFLINADLVDATFVAINRHLERFHHALRPLEEIRPIELDCREFHEQNSQPAQLGEPASLACGDPCPNGSRKI